MGNREMGNSMAAGGESPQAGQPSRSAADGIDMDTVPALLKAPVGHYQRRKRNFFVALAVFVGGFLASAIAGDLYDRYKPWKESDDEFINKIVAAQKGEFESVNATLEELRGSLPAEGRSAFRALQSSLSGLEQQSAGLVRQLELAHGEIATLRSIAESRGGVGAGYDFTLATNHSMDLAPGAVIGLQRIVNNGARVNLTSGGRNVANNRFLASGESLNYVGSDGRECFVSLMSLIPEQPGAASFKTGCLGAS